ncbi:major facilitator superfamily protein [Sarocladium implicatum]|nr:major facilitator superfamily protein [Sarocladium implicatum]
MSSQDPSTSPKLTSSSSPATQPATDAAAAASQPPQDSTMLSSRGANGEGQYRELEDDHGHERQTHEMTDMGNSHQQQHAAAGADSDNTTTAGSMTATTMQKEALHPRKDLPNWKWQGTLAVCFLTSLVNGYDVSNVANIQPRIYEAFGSIELLPWIGLSYSLAFFASLSFARKVLLIFNMRWVLIFFCFVFVVGAAVAGAAPNMTAVIVGRVIMGVAGACIQQGDMSYLAAYATPAESPKLFAILSTCWAIGLVIGGPIGSGFAANVTWRWAFYLNLPWVGVCVAIAFACLPSHNLTPPEVPLVQRLLKVDPLGIMFNMAAPVLLGIALTFSGPIWAWDDGRTIAIWVVFAVVFILWWVQQYFCIFTTAEQRAFPLHVLPRRDLLPIWIASGCAGASYAIVLYYTPLFFAFVKGASEMDQTVRLLPFILVFIVFVLTTGASLPAIGRYQIIYIIGGILTLAGAAAMATTLDYKTSEAHVMGLGALIGAGLGMHWQHGASLCNVINKDQRQKVDSIVIFNMSQMGAIAVALAMGGAIYQNVGFNLLSDALDGQDYTDDEIRAALAGVSSRIWQSRDPEVLARGAEAVADVIAREFWIVVAGGALCLVMGLLMKREKLDFGRPAKAKKTVQDKEVSSETA